MELSDLPDLTGLDAAATLAAVEERVVARRAGEVAEMLLALHWCGLHFADPQEAPGAVPVARGGDRLVQLGTRRSDAVRVCARETAPQGSRIGDNYCGHGGCRELR